MSFSFDASMHLGNFRYDAAFAADSELVVLFGHSGAGKSVTLQLFAGLMRPERGHIRLNGRVLTDTTARIHVRPPERHVGYVVQELALFPHMDVRQNIAFALDDRRGAAARKRVDGLLELLDLEGYGARMPRSLSGGQRQRVALARALAAETEILLLDEPFSALDESLREGLRGELLRLRRELGLPVLFVTHDLREAHLLADRLAIFDEGKLLQFGLRDDVFRRPASPRVATLTGVANLIRGRVLEAREGRLLLECAGMRLWCGPQPDAGCFRAGQAVVAAIRAELVNFTRHGEDHEFNHLQARVAEDLSYGAVHTIRLEATGRGPDLRAEIAARPHSVLGIKPGSVWTIELPPEDVHVMPAEDSAG